MATSSFAKDFTLNSKRAVEAFEYIFSKPSKSVKIDRSLTSSDNQKKGIEKLRRLSLR